MFSAVLKYGSSLIYGEAAEGSELSRVPATDGAERRPSLVDNLDENWVIIGDDVDEMTVLEAPVPIRCDDSAPKTRLRVTRRKFKEIQSSSKTNYSPYIKSESHFNHNKRSRKGKGKVNQPKPIMQPRQRSFK